MTWVLIVFVLTFRGPALDNIDFPDARSCAEAKAQVYEMIHQARSQHNPLSVHARCIAKENKEVNQ